MRFSGTAYGIGRAYKHMMHAPPRKCSRYSIFRCERDYVVSPADKKMHQDCINEGCTLIGYYERRGLTLDMLMGDLK